MAVPDIKRCQKGEPQRSILQDILGRAILNSITRSQGLLWSVLETKLSTLQEDAEVLKVP